MSFSGDPLEWPRFKRAFLYSSEAGGYSDKENAVRLSKILKDDALRAVESLMISSDSSEEIMRALERRYSDNGEILKKLISGIRKLPHLDSGHIDIVSFASTVHNNVIAMRAIGQDGSLENPELIQDVIRKMPQAMIFRYNDYTRNLLGNPNLQNLANFLINDADAAKRAGTAKLMDRGRPDRSEHCSRRFRVNSVVEKDRSRSPLRDRKCYFCSSEGHLISDCRRFKEKNLNARWEWAKQGKRCFKCLSSSHSRKNCSAALCKIKFCNRPHHSLLHAFSENRKVSTVNSTSNKTGNSNQTSDK